MAKQVFSNIYKHDMWTHGSGVGSILGATREYHGVLESFAETNQVRSIANLACGDMQHITHVKWPACVLEIRHYDVVDSVIEANKKNFPELDFQICDIITDTDDIKNADLILLKDCLIHLPNAVVCKLIPRLLEKCKFLIITNDIGNKGAAKDIHMGDGRTLTHSEWPMNQWPYALLHVYTPGHGGHADKSVICYFGKLKNP